MAQLTTAGRLLQDLNRISPSLRDSVLLAAEVSVDRANESMAARLKLDLAEQLRISEATALVAPALARSAMRLRAQVLAARNFESREFVDSHRDAPVERWERAASLRR